MTEYPGSTCSYDGITLVNSTVADTLQKVSVEHPVLGEEFACSMFLLGDTALKDVRDYITPEEYVQILGLYMPRGF